MKPRRLECLRNNQLILACLYALALSVALYFGLNFLFSLFLSSLNASWIAVTIAFFSWYVIADFMAEVNEDEVGEIEDDSLYEDTRPNNDPYDPSSVAYNPFLRDNLADVIQRSSRSETDRSNDLSRRNFINTTDTTHQFSHRLTDSNNSLDYARFYANYH